MHWKRKFTLICERVTITWFDLLVLVSILVGGSLYLHNALYWGIAWIGNSQYGDAEFWWNGALHIAEGALNYTNEGDGYRPGYFYLTGLTLPVLGQQFLQFYPYFLFAFLSSTGLFYLALRQSLNRWVSACVVGMLIFNPYTAEWLATSTTDGTGLLLNLLALTCLLFGFNRTLSRKWLTLFGLLFSLTTLTRPIITPFIVVVLLFILLIKQEPFKKRLNIASCVLIAFCIPTLLWMGIQKATIGQWSVSSGDASVFYAASDPAVQVWNDSMQSNVQKIAAKKYHVELSEVNNKMLNHVFWQEAYKNYIKYPGYHLKRGILNFIEIARFSPAHAAHGNGRWRVAFFEAIIANLLLWLFVKRRYIFVLVFLGIGFSICLLPKLITWMVLAGAFLALLQKDKIRKPAMPILSAYWLTGVVALYLVGGTWGELFFSHKFALNALGYRLGSQFFFVADILAAYFLVRLAQFKFESPKFPVFNSWNNFILRPNQLAGRIVITGFGIFFLATITTYLVGGSVVAYRAYALNHPGSAVPYPSLSPINEAYKKLTGMDLYYSLGEQSGTVPVDFSKQTAKKDIIFTGTISPFVWNLAGQKRAQIMVYAQSRVYPSLKNPQRLILDVPKHLNTSDWAGRQGAFIVHNSLDEHNKSNLPYYLTVPALRAFVPLASNKQAFDLSKAHWLPLVKNATQLETSGELKARSSQITWSLNSGDTPFQRRFFVTPKHAKPSVSSKVRLYLDTSTALGSTTLSFSYALGEIPEIPSNKTRQDNYQIIISTVGNPSMEPNILLSANIVSPSGNQEPLRKVNVSIPQDIKAIEITFNHLGANTGVWIYEFNLSLANFSRDA